MQYNYSISMKSISLSKATLFESDRDRYRSDFNIWLHEFVDTFTHFSLMIEDIDVSIECNWDEVIENLKWSYDNNITITEIQQKAEEEGITIQDIFDRNYHDHDSSGAITVSGVLTHDGPKHDTFDFIAVCIFHVWRASNLSFPGIISFYGANASISGEQKGQLHLSSDSLGNIYNSQFNNCYQIRPISIKKTWLWYMKVVDSNSFVTTNNFDRAISSLFNYARHDSLLQTDIVNLFLGVEAFYALDNRGIMETLKRRSIKFLKIDNNKKMFSKGIGDFYNYRSRLVHGDMDIISYIDILNNFVKDIPAYGVYYSSCEFGTFMILASLQRAIDIGITFLAYKEIEIITEFP